MLADVAHRLFLVHGSHPCVTVELALQRKGMAYKVVELVPPTQAIVVRALFGKRTVPALILDGGEKVSGSRAILRRLDELQPDPPMVPAEPDLAARVLAAEAWGDETFQPIARSILWPALRRTPSALPSYQRGSRLPALPGPVLKLLAPGVTTVEMKMNATDWTHAQQELGALPAHLDHIDALIADGTLGGEEPNAAEFQIAPTVRLLMTIGDARALIEGRPAAAWARRIAPEPAGAVPPGVFA